MDRLILFRHGKAERSAPGGDIARRLTDRGRRDAELMGRVLAAQGLVPDLALVSTAARAQETWEAASPAFPGARMLLRRDLYLAEEALIVDLAETLGESAGAVMVVGHNPGLHMLALSLLRQGGAGAAVLARAQDKFATATAAAFTFDAAGRPAYDGLFHASDHGGGGGE
ncbi:MAG TPA: histidine phosphatase family protein [Caulobacter sp.]|nr:histidine phosphatase family protein [Caulobacter sp.]